MPHSSPNAVHIQPTPSSPHTSKLLKLSAGVLSTSTNAPRTLLLEQKPWSTYNQPPTDTTHSSLLPKRNTTPHSSSRALPTLDISGEQSTPFFIVNLHLHSIAPFHRLPLLIPSAHSSRTKSHPFASHYSVSSRFAWSQHLPTPLSWPYSS